MTRRIAFACGLATFAALEIAWALGHRLLGWKSLWVLKTGTGIALCFAAFLLVAVAVSARYPQGRGFGECVLHVTAGGMLAMIVALFLVGAGNLWPIVIVFDGVIIAAAALVGAAIGAGFRKEAEG